MTQYQRFSDITNSGNFTPLLFETQNRTLDLLSVGIVSSPKLIDNVDGRFELIERINGSWVYRNKRVLPRAWLVNQTIVQDLPTMLTTIKTSRLPDGRMFDPLTMALVEEPIGFIDSALFSAQDKMAVNLVSLSNHKIELQTDNHQEAFLVLSENYSVGWQATINGEQHPLIRTNVSLRGLALPAGKHQVVLEYKPASLWWGLVVSSMSLLLCVAIVIYGKNTRLLS